MVGVEVTKDESGSGRGKRGGRKVGRSGVLGRRTDGGLVWIEESVSRRTEV